MRLCKQIVPVMKRQGGGTIVNMSSLGGLIAVPYMSSYTSAKFALEAFSEALYQEMKPHNISVVIMQPVAMNMDRPATGHHLRTVDLRIIIEVMFTNLADADYAHANPIRVVIHFTHPPKLVLTRQVI